MSADLHPHTRLLPLYVLSVYAALPLCCHVCSRRVRVVDYFCIFYLSTHMFAPSLRAYAMSDDEFAGQDWQKWAEGRKSHFVQVYHGVNDRVAMLTDAAHDVVLLCVCVDVRVWVLLP